MSSSAGRFSGYVVDTESLAAAGVETGDAIVYVKAVPGADVDAVQADLTAALADAPRVLIAGSLFLCGEALGILDDRGQIRPV